MCCGCRLFRVDALLKTSTAAVWASCLAACFPAPADLVGKACDDAHRCPEELVCACGTCQTPSAVPDAGTITNLQDDSDFEAGIFDTAWSTPNVADHLQFESTRVHSGNYAGQLTTDGGGTATLTSRAFSLHATSGGLHCATVWVSSDEITAPTLQLVRNLLNGPPVTSGTPPSSTATLDGGAQWVQLQTTISREVTDLDMQMSVYAPLVDGGSLFVDDVQVWLPANGTCGFCP